MHPFRILVFAVLFIPHTFAFAAVDSEYLSELIARAKLIRLADRPEWLKLVHYVPNLISPGVHGLVDSPGFYNAPDGKENPQSELEATLKSFFSDIEESNEQQNPQCLFIARYTWLNENLIFNPLRLRPKECKRYQQWHTSLNPESITIVFAAAYLNSPSSMYGHTLMRIDAKDQNERTRLLAYAVNFAASTDESNGVSFAINGLFGGYPGTFSILPYYAKVREYSSLENRDIWEYELNLTPEELDRVLMHVWEMGSVYFQYFFFDENCSYHLLALIQVARPSLDLTSQFRWWAIPSDTVKAIAKHPGMIKKAVYRPANATTLSYDLSMLSDEERRLVNSLGNDLISVDVSALKVLPDVRAAAVLEASQNYVNYQRAIGGYDVNVPSRLSHELASARGKLDVNAQTHDPPAPMVRPDQGHGSSRMAIGAGRKDGQNFQDLQIRATYHDIMDSDGGYARGAQIEFFSLDLRHYASDSARIEKFTPIKILSLTPRDDFFHPMSWSIETGWQRSLIPNGNDPLAFAVKGSIGSAWSNESKTALWYTLADAGSLFKKDMDKGYALGAGVDTGILYDLSSSWRFHGYVKGMKYFSGQLDTQLTYGFEQRFPIRRDLALRVDFSRARELFHTNNNGMASMHYYF